MHAAAAAGARTAVITGSATSPAGRAAEIVVATVEMDRSWCHTIGYLSPIIAAAAVAGELGGSPVTPDRLAARVLTGIDAAHAASDGQRPDVGIAETVARARHLLVVGSGIDRVTGRELTLKVEEAAWIPSAMRDLETFLHGHLPATGPATALILVLLERRGLEARARRAPQAPAPARAAGGRAAAGPRAAPPGAIPGGRPAPR